MPLALGLLSVLASLASAACAPCQDRIWLEPQRPTESQSRWYPRSIETRSGKIIRFDASQLQIVVDGDEVATLIAATRVLWVEPGDRSPAELAALQLFADGQYAQSVRPLLDVLAQRPPVWRQQWLSMTAAYAAWRSSRGAIAIELVSQLDKRPLAPLTIGWLPIAWRGGAPQPEAIDAAQKRLTDPSPAVRLVAASWLLSSQHRSPATAVLQQLAVNDERPLIAVLAEAVLWRVATPPQVVESIGDWQQKLDSLPMVLQVGPTITLIEKLRSAGRTEAATHLELSLKLTPPFPHPEIETLSH